MRIPASLPFLARAFAAAATLWSAGAAFAQADPQWICPPCGADCHVDARPAAGSCGLCGMELVRAETVPHVGVLIFDGVDLLSMAAPASVLQAADVARVFTVADTAEPVRSQAFQTVVPQFALGSAPHVDVLVVPGGYGAVAAADDALVLGWVRRTAAGARCVVGIAEGTWVLARAGVLDGHVVAAPARLAERLAEACPGVTVDAQARTRGSGRVRTARHAAAGAELALELVRALGDEARARRVAAELGVDWQPDPEGHALPLAPPRRGDEPETPQEPAPAAPPAAAARTAGGDDEPGLDWPKWRGPAGDGVSLETGLTDDGAPEPLWRAELGLGHSCVSVAGGRVFAIGFDEAAERDVVRCLDAESGAERWRFAYPAVIRNLGHGGGTLATPAFHRGRLYVAEREGELRCLDAETGKLLWHRRLAAELDLRGTEYGFGGSPLPVGDLVVYEVAAVVALAADNGELVWRTEDLEAMYSTPAAFEHRGRPLLASFTRKGVHVIDRRTGEVLCSYPWRKGETTVNASTPVVIGDRLFISSGYEHGGALLQLDDDARRLRPLWESRAMRTRLSGCVHHGGYLYGFDEGTLKCLDLEGNERWRKRGLGMGALCVAGDRLVVLSHRGELVIAAATPDGFAELSRRQVLSGGGAHWTSPVVAHGRIYCRNGLGQLVCLDHRRR